MDKALTLKDVSFQKGNRQIFSNVNLEIGRGEITALLGAPSGNIGCFEDLLLRKTDAADSIIGSIILDAAETEKLSHEALRFLRMVNIGILPKNASAGTLRMTVQSYLLLPFRESIKKTKREILLDAKRIMELIGIHNTESILKKKMNRLSENDLRAVLYAAALSTDPAVALCYADINISPEEKEALFKVLIKVCKIKNIALILLTGDAEFAKKYGEKVYLLQKNNILPYTYDDFLENAARMHPISKNAITTEEVIRASHIKPSKRNEKTDFTLYKREIIPLSMDRGLPLFLGKKKPYRGNIYADNIALPRNKSFRKQIMHVSGKFQFLPAKTVGPLLSQFAKRPSLKEDMGRILDFLPLPEGFTDRPACCSTLFETLFLGLLCAAMSESKLILLSDMDSLSQKTEKYELLTLLSAICERTGAGAVVFSEDKDVHLVLSSKSLENNSNKSTNEERIHAYADAT